MQEDKKSEMRNVLDGKKVCCVSTGKGGGIKNRMMHFAYSKDFTFYLASVKHDPKIKQIALNSDLSLLVYSEGDTFPGDKEIEVTGRAEIIRDGKKKEEAIKLLLERSPVVKSLIEAGQGDLMAFIEVVPQQVKFRVVADILRGGAPYVLEYEGRAQGQSDWELFKKKAEAWVAESRYPFLTASILPVVLGAAAAWAKNSAFNPFYFILTLLGVAFLHLGSNIINDYFDHKSGNDDSNTEFVRPFSGGSRMIQLGILSPLEVVCGAAIFFIMGSGIGLYLAYKLGQAVLWIGIAGAAIGFFYVSPLFGLAKKGIGEIASGLAFGVLIIAGSYYAQAGSFSAEILWLSAVLGLLASSILWINEFPDYNADKATGKRTLVVRMGRKNASKVFVFSMAGVYAVLACGVAAGYLPKITLLGMVSLPFAIKAMMYAVKFYDRPFDMAPGNGFTILCFNVLAIALIASYLWNKMAPAYFLPLLCVGIVYILWMNSAINNQQKAFIKLKEIM